jgi:hypothetical protein
VLALGATGRSVRWRRDAATHRDLVSDRVLVVRARDRVIGELRDQHDRDGVLCELVVREAAASLGCSPRSVRRWLAAGTPSGHKSAVLIDDELYAAYSDGMGTSRPSGVSW